MDRGVWVGIGVAVIFGFLAFAVKRMPRWIGIGGVMLGVLITIAALLMPTSKPDAQASSAPQDAGSISVSGGSNSGVVGNVSGGCVITGGTDNACRRDSHKIIHIVQPNIGILSPAKDTISNNRCGVKEGDVAIYAGSNGLFASRFPALLLEIANHPILVVNKKGKNIEIKTLKIFDDRENIIASIDSDGFWTEPNVRIKRPDKSTLIFYDHLDNEALWIRLADPAFIKIRGIFRYPGHAPLTVDSENMILPGNNVFRESCFGNAGKAFISMD